MSTLKDMTLEELIEIGDIHFNWEVKRMEENGIRDFYVRLTYRMVPRKAPLKLTPIESPWEGFATVEEALSHLTKAVIRRLV